MVDTKQKNKTEVGIILISSLCSSMVEQRPPKAKVEGSIPFTDVFLLIIDWFMNFKYKIKSNLIACKINLKINSLKELL